MRAQCYRSIFSCRPVISNEHWFFDRLWSLLKVILKSSVLLFIPSFIFPIHLLIHLPQIKTRISTCDAMDKEDSTVLYAFEPNPACVKNQEPAFMSEAVSPKEQPKTMVDVLSHCQVIYDAIQSLEKKCDVIHGKISKIHRRRSRMFWCSRSRGYAYKCYAIPFFKRVKLQKKEKKETIGSFSYPVSYSPTLPVQRPGNDSQLRMSTSIPSLDDGGDSYIREPDEPEPVLRESPFPSRFPRSYPQYFSDEPLPSTSAAAPPRCGSPGSHSIASIFSTRASALPPSIMASGQPPPPPLETKLSTSGACFPPGFATSSPIEPHNSVLKSNFTDEPSGWSVEEVIMFLKQTDSQAISPIADLFRQHEIDGKALLLLSSDMLIKHMGLKLGLAVKLCHSIEKLKEEKCSKI
nr:sex comb on midleg-like protein 1 isoform X3 [Oryctolagus cuniculus]